MIPLNENKNLLKITNGIESFTSDYFYNIIADTFIIMHASIWIYIKLKR